MRFEDKLRKSTKEKLWQEYCGYLDMSLSEYMYTQRRLMKEQIGLWCGTRLGKTIYGEEAPDTVEEFLEKMPLTQYGDYANELLKKNEDALCEKPAIWIDTTWEGGLRPVKTAPYTRAMLDTYRHNLISVLLLGAAGKKNEINVMPGDRILYGGAPLPYATGLMPSLVEEDLHLEWLPDNKNSLEASFSRRIAKGLAMAFSGGVDYFFGIGSVSYYLTQRFAAGVGSKSGGHGKVNPAAAFRYLRGKYRSYKEDRELLPKDVFKLKAFYYAGTDGYCYKDSLARAWGVNPYEIAAGTESTCIGCEDWEHNGMVLFPNACFYEFIPEEEMNRSLRDKNYTPRTCLMDQVRPGRIYEIVLSVFHGGAFMRYRIGDVYRCTVAGNNQLPRFTYLDRTPNVIDIAGFTRITEASTKEVIELSRLKLDSWILKKEFDERGLPFLHMYIEIPPDTAINEVVTIDVLRERLSIYFKYYDSDYQDLKRMLNMDPLNITVLKYGTIRKYEEKIGQTIPRINPGELDIAAIMKN